MQRSDIANSLDDLTREIIRVTGVVQGVGFRPFIFRLAAARGLKGSVRNTPAGVEIDVEGLDRSVADFIAAMRSEAPPNARITGIEQTAAEPRGFAGFEIAKSTAGEQARQLVSADCRTCDECLGEMRDPADRRHRYPFINCTNCGPRFTIIERLPYDRASTTMKGFTMCPACQAEYDDPGDRRFHAEPNACPVCGPSLWLASKGGTGGQKSGDDPVRLAAGAILSGDIVALKGLGGFQLACLATDEKAVARLRERKRRPHKPFAIMVGTADDAGLRCRVSGTERALLESVERPIVLLECIGESDIATSVAPGLSRLGVMLPCAPLHFLLWEEVGAPLVMTSGNVSDEPICRTNEEAAIRLAGIADHFLLHDRGIRSAYDDSVVMAIGEKTAMIRRARGYAPLPVDLPAESWAQDTGAEAAPLLATGGELKNTFCLARGRTAFVSQHIGDLSDAETLLNFERTITVYEELFGISPSVVACDSHPDYLSTAYAMERHAGPLSVQHHEAHMASCLAENAHLDGAVGVVLDGTGYGSDHRIWGGEFFTGSLERGFERAAHISYMPLPGGDAAVREPWRTALGSAWRYAPDRVDFVAGMLGIPARRKDLLVKQLWSGLNSPQTSSCGRLFDAVAALVMRRLKVSYEAQAAMELEALAGPFDPADTPLLVHEPHKLAMRFSIEKGDGPWILSPEEVMRSVIDLLEQGEDNGFIARSFHLALAEAILQTAAGLADLNRVKAVALSGGVFQNRLLLQLAEAGLGLLGYTVLTQSRLPANDGGISFGQAALARSRRIR